MRTGPLAVAAAVALGLGVSAAPQSGRASFELAGRPEIRNKVDELVFAKLKSMHLEPAAVSSDAVFLRRVYLDTIGTLPTADEARAFLGDRSPARRQALVEQLLERPEFADYWAMRWSDLLRVKSEFPINLWPNAVQAYHRWIRTSIRDNVPYDRFVRDLLTSNGSNFRVPPVNFYRAVQSKEPYTIASAVALGLMGMRADDWPRERLADMSVFFSQVSYKATGEWKEEIVFFDPEKPLPGAPAGGPRDVVFPDGTKGRILPGQDPREVFAGWLTTPSNPYLARAVVNRIWYWILGRGIVHEPDDLRADNPPANPELLALLEKELIASRFNLRQIYKLILTSSTYQLSAIPRADTAEAEANFAHAIVRPLDAEVLIDAINQITGGTEEYSSAIPEPYTFVPPDQRSIALADGSITSAFLETFGRSPRDSGLVSERNARPSAAQRLYLLNSADIQRKLQQGGRLAALMQGQRDPREMVNTLYLAILSRYPSEDELRAVGAYLQQGGANRRGAGLDIAWALLNTAEFRYRH
jgi:hypothetical protein